ncbi:apolipoprotein N-acyltransferase [Candidatus Poribacteria bacterium]|nr:MAG: apolipoprotein N-acyltransferase [Candidatus Poribacteria bacterium]
MGDIPTDNLLKRHQHWLLAILSAFLLFLSFPNVNLYPLAWIAMVPFFIALTRATGWKSAFWIGYLTGLLFFAGLLLAIILLYPYENIFATTVGYLLLVGYTGLYFAVFAALMQFGQVRSGILFPLAAACIWTALEWVRSWLMTGFPWGSIGYSQWNNLIGIQVASVVGVHGISFVIVLFNAGIATVLRNRQQWRQEIRAVVLPVVLMLLCFGYGAFQLQDAEPLDRETNATVTTDTETLNVALIPGNISQLQKWDVNQFPAILRRYINLTYKASRAAPDLIVWPETSIRSQALTGEWPIYYGRFSGMLRETAIPIIVGTANRGETDEAIGKFSKDADKKSEPIYNRVLSIASDGKIHGTYAKMHLVPFGEYVPLENLLPDFIPDFIQFEPFAHGKTVNLLPVFIVKDKTNTVKRTDGLFRDAKVFVVKDKADTQKVEIGASICFESVFPNEFRRPVQKGARVMGIFTNDAWFDGTAFPELHLSMAPFRAIENRIAVFRCANGGFTCIVDKFGRITTPMVAPNATQEVLIAPVPLLSSTKREQTLYTRYGDWFPILCMFICAGGFGSQLVIRRWRKHS